MSNRRLVLPGTMEAIGGNAGGGGASALTPLDLTVETPLATLDPLSHLSVGDAVNGLTNTVAGASAFEDSAISLFALPATDANGLPLDLTTKRLLMFARVRHTYTQPIALWVGVCTGADGSGSGYPSDFATDVTGLMGIGFYKNAVAGSNYGACAVRGSGASPLTTFGGPSSTRYQANGNFTAGVRPSGGSGDDQLVYLCEATAIASDGDYIISSSRIGATQIVGGAVTNIYVAMQPFVAFGASQGLGPNALDLYLIQVDSLDAS